jgi:hypothetical protein
LSLVYDGSVIAYDVEAPVVQSTILIPSTPSELRDGRIATNMSYSINAMEDHLTFNIAIQLSLLIRTSGQRRRISIWRATLHVIDDKSWLSATHIWSFETTIYDAGPISLFGNTLAISDLPECRRSSDVDVYKWEECTDDVWCVALMSWSDSELVRAIPLHVCPYPDKWYCADSH